MGGDPIKEQFRDEQNNTFDKRNAYIQSKHALVTYTHIAIPTSNRDIIGISNRIKGNIIRTLGYMIYSAHTPLVCDTNTFSLPLLPLPPHK